MSNLFANKEKNSEYIYGSEFINQFLSYISEIIIRPLRVPTLK